MATRNGRHRIPNIGRVRTGSMVRSCPFDHAAINPVHDSYAFHFAELAQVVGQVEGERHPLVAVPSVDVQAVDELALVPAPAQVPR